MKLAKKSLIISIIFGVNALIQLINQIVTVKLFGASLGLEVFLASIAVPTFIVSAIYATLSDAFLPIYGRLRLQDKHQAKMWLGEILGSLSLVFVFISLGLIVIARPISYGLYASRGLEFVDLVAQEMRVLLISLPIAVMTVVGGGKAYAEKRFFKFPLMQLMGNGLILMSMLFLSQIFDTKILVISFLASLLLQAISLIPKNNLKLKLNFVEHNRLWMVWLPMLISFFVFRSEGLVVKYFAGMMPSGYLVYLNLASKFFSMATGVATIGIQILLLPHLVDKLNTPDDITSGLQLVKKSKWLGISMASIIAISVLLLAPWVLKLLFLGGKFTLTDIESVESLLKWFVVPAVGWGIYPIFLQPLIAMGEQKKIAGIAISAGLMAGLVGWLSYGSGVMISMTMVLTTLMLTGIILSEVVWQKIKRTLVI